MPRWIDSTATKNQFSFNKMIKTQLAQVAATMPPALENVKAITTRGGKTTQDPPYPNHVNRKKASPVAEEPPREEEPEKVHEGKTAPHEFYDTQVLLLTLLSAPDLYTASARFCVAFPSEYSPKVYQSTEPKRQETIY